MESRSLQNHYHLTNQQTLAVWRENPTVGNIRKARYYDPTRLALATGIKPMLPQSVRQLIGELQDLSLSDRLADIIPMNSVHFTFLPLTLPLFDENERLPATMSQLFEIWTPYQGKRINITNLRLLALPSQLLLAGIADESAIAMRQSFCEEILDSHWKDLLLARHANSSLPAPFWHCTLLRYGAACLPAVLRDFFTHRQAMEFGEVSGELTLARVSYNWAECYPLSAESGEHTPRFRE